MLRSGMGGRREMTDDRLTTATSGNVDEWSPGNILPAAWTHRKGLLTAATIVAAATLIVNLLLPAWYRTTAKLLPDLERSRPVGLGQAAEVAQLVGVGGPSQDPGRLYPAILTSETILREAILTRYRTQTHPDSVDLIGVFNPRGETPEENLETISSRLRDLMGVQFESRTGVVTVSLEMRDPQLAADVLNTIIGSLDLFMRRKRATNATEQRKWVEMRLRDIRLELRTAEENLRSFREKNRRMLDSPLLLLEQERYVREVQMKSAVLIELIKQLELAKIEEIRNIAIVSVLDPARPPVRRERPRRAVNTILAFIGTLLAGAAIVGVRSMYPSAFPLLRLSTSRQESAVRME